MHKTYFITFKIIIFSQAFVNSYNFLVDMTADERLHSSSRISRTFNM